MEVDDARVYKLSCQLRGHEDDVRGLCAFSDSDIATASRDSTLRIWHREGTQFKLVSTLTGHTSFVGPVAWIPPSEDMPLGGLVSGGMDTNVIVWDLGTCQPQRILTGHALQVTSVVVGQNGDIYSASVDNTVKRWTQQQMSESITAHNGPVQAVLLLPTGELISGSTDTTIKVWKGTRCLTTIKGHSDTVRSLALLPDVGVLSASHDGSVKLWSFNGEQLIEMVGHTEIVYSVAGHSSGEVASGSEDCHAKLWRDGVCHQSILHPGCVWDVKFLPNGDLVTACSDGVARVWTTAPERFASQEEMTAYEQAVLLKKTERKNVGGVNVSELPSRESLENPGSADGQTKVIREGDVAVAYSWNLKEYKWDKIGELVDAPGAPTPGRTLNGASYDYVFDVDIGDGLPTRRLPYNRGENPYIVADKWLLNEELPIEYKQQVVDFILQNTGQQPSVQLDNTFYDPYTGANAYVPGQQAGSRVSAQPRQLKHIPKKGMVVFDAIRPDGMLKKLAEFSEGLRQTQSEISLECDELERLREMVTNKCHTFSDADFAVFTCKLFKWPTAKLFPVIDLTRFLLLHADAARLFSLAMMEVAERALSEPNLAPNVFLSARAIVNCFRHLQPWLISHLSHIIDLYSDCAKMENKNIRSAYATLLLNYGVAVVESQDSDAQMQLLSAALELAGAEEDEGDSEVRFMSLQAVGTLIHSGVVVKRVAMDLGVKGVVEGAKKCKVAKVREVGEDIELLLS